MFCMWVFVHWLKQILERQEIIWRSQTNRDPRRLAAGWTSLPRHLAIPSDQSKIEATNGYKAEGGCLQNVMLHSLSRYTLRPTPWMKCTAAFCTNIHIVSICIYLLYMFPWQLQTERLTVLSLQGQEGRDDGVPRTTPQSTQRVRARKISSTFQPCGSHVWAGP